MGFGKVTFTALVLLYFGTVRSQTPTLYQNTLTCPSGWTYLGGDKCYKVYQGNYERTWHRAKNICERYGSHLVNFKDQEEANKVGDLVNTDPLNPKSFWIGVFCPEKLCATGAFNTRGEAVTPNQATAWVDGQPNWKTGQCVYTKKNHVKYVFEKPYAQSMDHCSVKRSFVCERMAAPPDSFHCFSGGYVHGNNLCNGRHDCQDGSDEMDCPGNCNYYYNVASGQISLPTQFTRNYDNSQTCTWAIKTPLGSNVYINFTTFNTEEDEDTVQVYEKSVVEVNAVHVSTLSGQQNRDVAIRSSNNMMYIKFSSDGSVTRPGFQATFDSVTTNLAYEVMELTATSAPATYSTPVHVVGGVGAFVAMTDYVYLISANDPYQIVTVEILNLKLGDDDKIVFYDGESPHSMELLTVCSNCEDYTVISSTGRYLSIHLSTDKPVESAFTFRYKQGCDVTLTNDYGMLFSPGYVGNIKYPNNIVCTWTVNVDEPISIYFDSDLDFEDDFTCLDRSNDYLKVFEGLNENGTPLHSGDGFMAAQLRGTTHQSASGKFFLQFMSSPTMNSRGFMARWSKDCVSPMYDEYTIINSGAITMAPYHYTSTMTLTCDTGYGFHQQQIPAGQIAVTLTCNYKGEWNWKKIPRCTPNYCGVAPDIMNGYIAYSTKSVYEGVASYECYPGSSLVSIVGPGNNNNITCQANGEWQTPPFCRTATCNLNLVNQRPPNGEGTIRTGTGNGTTIGSIIDFSCADGFEIDGDPILICMDNGQWSSNNPTCKRKTCLLPSIPNGQVISVSSFIDFGSIVSVQCDTGYEFEDPAVNSMECLADRTLDQIPVCVDIDECDASPCQTYCHNNIGSFTCSCDPGYELVGQTVCNDKDECSSGEHKCDGFCTNTPPGSYTCSCSLPEVLFTSNGLHGYFVPSSETGYLPTDTLRIDQSCVLISCDDPQDPQNGRYFPKRTKHRYGDVIEYQCNLGYGPRSSTRTCLQNGQWSAPPPDCLPEQCPNDVFTNPANEASFQIGPYDYLEDLYLNCTVATKNFLKRRKCVYNPAIDRYEMQGSSYECGELDCGTPYQAPGSNYFAFDTTYGASFEFGCSAGNNPTGSSSETVIDNTVTCGADGYWNFGNLQCFSQSCNDPGYPAGGEMIASSFADRSIVTFRCTKSGYTLTHTDSIVCLGTIFNGTAPRCVDTTPPSIGLANGQPCDGTYTITVKKYSSIPLPTVLYSDNDGIATFTVEPANANTTLKVENDLTVVFRATDYSGYESTCRIFVRVEDETPPTIDCPSQNLLTVYIDTRDEIQTLDLTSNMFILSDNFGVQNLLPISYTNSPPSSYSFADLYQTFPFTATVRDQNGNSASCQAQVFVTSRSCTPNSFPMPLHAQKSCTPTTFPQGYTCTITCDDRYHFEDDGGNGKTRTVSCQTNANSGAWNTQFISACVRDITYPRLTCPPSQEIDLIDEQDYRFVDFENTVLNYNVSDLNTIKTTVFSVPTYNFTVSDMYMAREVVLTVTDSADLQSSCRFQYVVKPRICSPLSYREPRYSSKSCSRNVQNTGYRCVLTADDGYLFRDHGVTATVNCLDNFAWDEVIPAAVPDTIAPTVSCPQSRTLYLDQEDDFIDVVFGGNYFSDYDRSDDSGTPAIAFQPDRYNFTRNNLYQTISVSFIATDKSNNAADCQFYVHLLPAICSPLALPDPVNGRKTCTSTFNGWSCELSCDAGYGFSHTSSATQTISCFTGSAWSGEVPGCSSLSNTAPTVYFGIYEYKYQPVTGQQNVDESCGTHYLRQQSRLVQYTLSNGTVLQMILHEAMADRMQEGCRLFANVPRGEVDITFIPELFTLDVLNIGTPSVPLNRQVVIYYTFTMTAMDANYLDICSSWLRLTLPNVPNGYEFAAAGIPGDGANCPELNWDNRMNQTSEGYQCLNNYFISPLDSNECRPCPAGSISNSVSCTPCEKGTYHASPSSMTCTSCGGGRTTRIVGATSASQCVLPCPAGQVSEDGYSPCSTCPIGEYSIDTRNCVPCGFGNTTSTVGSSSPLSCIPIVTQKEPCGAGTEAIGDECVVCPEGEYRPLQASQCIPCSTGTTTFVVGAIESTECYDMCSGGNINSLTGKPPCTACPIGSYYRNSTYCESCPSGQTTRFTGSVSQLDCLSETSLRVNCPQGTFRNGTGCAPCERGTYAPSEEMNSCFSCPVGSWTYYEGATSRDMCFSFCYPGTTSPTGLSPCSPCGVGFYAFNATLCEQCPAGTSTKTDTASSSLECIPECSRGQFSVSGYNFDNTCKNCPANFYQDVTGRSFCEECLGSQYTSTGLTGLSSSADCLNTAPQDLCFAGRCSNGGTCVIQDHDFYCQCATGYYGRTCTQTVNFCENNPCFNGGNCQYTSAGYTCDCRGLATGARCENVIETCSSDPDYCQNGGHCRNLPGRKECLCADGFSGATDPTCSIETPICIPNPCQNGGQCVDTSFGENLRRKCICASGYEGVNCEYEIDYCASSPCLYGGVCQPRLNGYRCDCTSGYTGQDCETRQNQCNGVNCQGGTCVDDYTLNEPRCICAPGYYYGSVNQYNIQLGTAASPLPTNPTTNGSPDDCRDRCSTDNNCASFSYNFNTGDCYIISIFVTVTPATAGSFNHYTKVSIPQATDNYWTQWYDMQTPANSNQMDDTESRADLNNNYGLNICEGTEPIGVECRDVNTKASADGVPGVSCTTNGLTCSGFAACNDYEVRYLCAVHRVFKNNQCSLRNYCSPNPCPIGSTCSNDYAALSYRCSCPSGLTGLNCQNNIDDCANTPCKNGGICNDRLNGYDCDCQTATGYTGRTCETRIAYCDGQNCNFRGRCELELTGYKCNCQPGYDGKDCENEIDKCVSSPCLHGGNCQKRFNDYFCDCPDGWTGKNCDVIVDNCASGGRFSCNTQCYSIFNDYYCKCPANTYGRDCEYSPDPCRDYNKCQNGAQCNYDLVNNMTCSCDMRYTGDGCEILVDHCSATTNNCQNGAMCMTTQTGYRCVCAPGYNGSNCEKDIEECTGVECEGGTCIEDIGKHYCRCPLGKTGVNCEREKETDYDICFNHPEGLSYAKIPFPNLASNADSMSITLWVRFAQPGTEGTYFTMFIGDRLRDADTFMEFRHDGVRVYISTDSGFTPYTMLPFTYGYTLTDGSWHSMVLNYDLANGVMTLIADSITHTVIQNAALIIAERTFRFWVVIGCEFDQFSDSCVMGSRFHGCVSQVNFYKRELDFNTEPPILIRDPRHVFSPRIDVLLVWNEYELRGGERTIPSEADVASCVGRCKSYPVLSRPTISASNPCPGDMMVYSADRLTTVSWNEPVFENAASIIRPDFQSGASYHWGTYQITYIAVGANDEKAICSFKLYVQSSQCDTPPDPLGGFQTCEEDPYGYRGCSLACSSSSSRNYTIDRVVPNLFTCGPTGSWNVMKRFNRFRYPPCGEEYAQPARTRLYMKVVYQIATEACKAAEINFNGRVLDQFRLLNDEMNGGLCADTNCSDLQISIKCGPNNVNTISTLEVTIPDCVQRTIIDGENIPTQDFITCSVLGAADILNFADTIPNGYIMRSTYFITPTLICPTGRVLINDECVLCGAGTYYTMDSDGNPFCEDCPIGEYQNGEGEMSCESCGPNLTTEMMGSNDFSQCKAICPIGEYYTGDSTGCMPCPVGYFQDEVGQFFCKFCERGQTTSDPGATSRSQCQETCPSGQQLVNNGCVKCGIGFYRNETESRLCVSCPSGKITPAEGAVSRGDCYVEACEAGNRLNEQTNTCEPCPLGSYQDTKWQTFCIPCGSPYNWRTDSVGSADPTDCKFYCPSGEEAVDATSPGRYCRYCPIGTYKNNNFDIYGQCRPCSGNYRTETVGSVSEQNCTIYLCPAGERPNIDNTDCEMCPLGTYQPIQHSTDCISCNQGTSTRNEGATAETECEIYCASGQEKNSIGNCDVCDRGYYKNNALGLFSMCMPCPENYTTVERETEQEADCTIRACPAGTKRNALDTDCIECERGTYQQLPYQTMCDFCPSGTSTRQTKSTNRNQCEIFCQPGAEKNTVTGGCDTCSRGYYKDNSIDLFSVCTMCPIDRITASTGAVSISNCTIGNCTAGYRIDANDDCEICPKGFYQDQWWQRSCIQCGTDKTTEDPGATRADLCILKCPPGKQDVGGRCEECPRGYYKDQDIAAACTECPFGTTTEGTGATDQATCSLPACQVGEYLDRTGVVYDCKQCGYDTYQDEIWQETCKSCPAGLVTLMMGAQMITQCVRNCSSGSEYNIVTQGCDECAIGYYRNQFNRLETTCQLCDINFITATTGATSVNDCNIRNCTTPGEYRKDNQCEPCPIGTYLNEKWQTACTNCPEGYKTLNTGSISISDCRPTCPAGEFVGINNVCQKCPRGTYRDGLSGENCESCPDGLLTPGLGAVNDSECYISPCFKGKYYVRARQECVFCERGTYQDEDGKFQCKECPNPIKYTPAVGADDVSDCNSPCLRGRELDVAADTCDLCEVGYYQDADYQFSCIQCPPEKAFTSSRGSTSFTDCKNRCDAGNDCPSNALCVSTSTSFTCECFPNHVDFFGNGKDCRACSAGEYFITNANRCQACPARKYQPNEAQSECLTCPDDTEPNSDSTACVHKCDLSYCQNGGTCNVGPPITCSCKKWYKGETCGDRYDAEDLADRPLDIAIPVSIGVGALILILIIIAVACFVCFRRTPKPHGQYSEFVDRTDKVSVHSYGQTPYNFASQKMMLAPGSEMVYDNQAYTGSTLAGDPAVFVA